MVTVSESLQSIGKLEECGGAGLSRGALPGSAGPSNVRPLCRADPAKGAAALADPGLHGGREEAFQPHRAAGAAIRGCRARIFELRQRRLTKETRSFDQLLSKVYESIDQRHQNAGEITGLSTGFAKVDAMTAGCNPGTWSSLLGARAWARRASR
jgi:replicative DNA helicase